MAATTLTDAAQAASALKDALVAARNVVVLTGAGLSTQSGIPDFRSPGGIWTRMEPILFDDFCRSEDARLEDWRRRFQMAELFEKAEPNPAHRAIAHWARAGKVELVVTQNIDGLHRRAGTPPDKLIEIHGTGAHAHCLSCGERMEIAQAQRTVEDTGRAPRCLSCGGLVKAAVISFGQPMPQRAMSAAQDAVCAADLLIAAGTSLVVYPVADLPRLAREAGARLVIASRAPTEQDDLAHLVIRSQLSETFGPLEHIKFG